ncbi:DUF554 family protein [Paenibacillus polymyxa]|uniref:DUF554 family protein n=1 Tax=Paenibacillus polymyxa TaxID=1406 RepID=UPI0037C8FCE3
MSNIMTRFSSNGLNEGLTVAISLLCVGSIPILGPLQSALQGDNTFLQINTIFSGITPLILASTFVIGIIFSVKPAACLIYPYLFAVASCVI